MTHRDKLIAFLRNELSYETDPAKRRDLNIWIGELETSAVRVTSAGDVIENGILRDGVWNG